MTDNTVSTEIPPANQENITEDISPQTNDQPLPDTGNDLYKVMKIDKLVITDVGPNITIDVQPDFRNILIQLVDHVVKIFQQIEQLKVPIITPATLLAYSLESIYAYGAIADIYNIRATASYFAQEILTVPNSYQFMNLLHHARVPPFVREILQGLQYTFDPRRKNIGFIYSFAAFSFDHDFGKTFPIHMFLRLHNLISEHGHDHTSEQIWREWLMYTVVQDGQHQITVANIIGAAYNEHLVINYVTAKLKSLLIACMPRQGSQECPYVEIPFDDYPQQENLSHVNPYFYLLASHPTLVHPTTDFFNEMTSKYLDIFPKVSCVAELYGLESGISLLNHYYSDWTLPTYHALPVKITDKSKTTTAENYATALKYMHIPKKKKNSSTPKTPGPSRLLNINSSLYLLGKSTGSNHADADPLFNYDKKHKDTPILIYSPWNTGISSYYYPVTNGLVIETHEIDGFHVPFPNNDENIRHENSYVLQSAMPFRCTVHRGYLNGAENLEIRERVIEPSDTHSVSLSFDNMSSHRLPLYPVNVASENAQVLTPGFTSTPNVSDYNNGSNKVAFETTQKWTKALTDSVFPSAQLAWSSYRWIDPSKSCTEDFYKNKYFITNFRTLYGTMPLITMAPAIPKLLK